MLLIIKNIGVPVEDGLPIPTSSEWWVKLLDHGTPALIVVVVLFFFLGLIWSLKARLGGLLLAWKRQSETMTEELPAIRRGVEKLAEEANTTLRAVHDDVRYIKGAVSSKGA